MRAAYENTLLVAEQSDIQSLAFPNISTGIYRFPKQQAAEIAVQVVREHALKPNRVIQKIVFICFDQESYNLYATLLA